MQQGGDYSSHYHHHHHPNFLPNQMPNPLPNPNEFPPSNENHPPFASAPPYSPYPPSESPNFSSPYPPYSPNPDPIPNLQPSAPSYAQPQSQPNFRHSEPLNPPPYAQDPSLAATGAAHAPYHHHQQPYYAYDSHHPAFNLGPSPNPNPSPSPYPSYENQYENPSRFDQGSGGYFNDNSVGGYGFAPETGGDGLGDGVYAYDGGNVEPYGARGTGGFGRTSSPTNSSQFDDYGRSLGPGPASGVKEQPKIVRAVPKMESQQDVKNGVQKFRVKLLPEGANVTTTDVLCQIGLDGIHMLDPSTNRTLRIYPLENVTRWDVLDSNIFAFWSESPVDIEPRRIRLQSNSFTTSTILDTVTAATVQLKEMGAKDNLVRSKGPADASKTTEQISEKKKGFVDWMHLIKPANVEKDHWVPDEAASKCSSCATHFGAFVRKHHCRNCGDIFCDKCTQGRITLTADEDAQPVRVCDRCLAEVSQRLTNANESANKSTAIHSHVDLARKLQEEMERNRKSSSGSKSSDLGMRMREVECPICTVHLQVQVPTSGSETIECGVCQHPFLVSAH